MVASQDLEPGTGWKYDDWLRSVLSNPEMDGKRLSTAVVQYYRKVYEYRDKATTLTGISLSEMNIFASSISRFADLLKETLKENANLVRNARKNCYNFAPQKTIPNPYYHIDLVQFCNSIAGTTKDHILRETATSIIEMSKKSVVIANYAGEFRWGKYGSFGLAIYFPPSGKAYSSDERADGGYDKKNKKFPVEFVSSQRWADFLYAYFDVFKE